MQFNINGGTSAVDRSFIRYSSFTSQTDYYYSCYIKSANGQEQKILWQHGGDDNEFTVTTEWQRVELDRNGNAETFAGFSLRGGISTVDSADVLVWGFQVEQGSYATSYIPTQGSAATRVKDECNASGLSSVIGQTEGTIFIDFEYNQTPTDVNGRLLQLWGTNETTNSILPFIQGPGANENQFQLTIFSANTGTPAITASAATNVPFGRQKFAIAYNSGVYTVYRNGSLFASASSLVPVSLTALDLGGSSAADRSLVNPIKQAQLYNTRLSNSELATLTTL